MLSNGSMGRILYERGAVVDPVVQLLSCCFGLRRLSLSFCRCSVWFCLRVSIMTQQQRFMRVLVASLEFSVTRQSRLLCHKSPKVFNKQKDHCVTQLSLTYRACEGLLISTYSRVQLRKSGGSNSNGLSNIWSYSEPNIVLIHPIIRQQIVQSRWCWEC